MTANKRSNLFQSVSVVFVAAALAAIGWMMVSTKEQAAEAYGMASQHIAASVERDKAIDDKLERILDKMHVHPTGSE